MYSKRNKPFKWAAIRGRKWFFVSPTNWQGEEIFVSFVEASWGPLWKEKNDKFEEFLQGDMNLRLLFGKMFHV
jgi:hypothetical protein